MLNIVSGMFRYRKIKKSVSVEWCVVSYSKFLRKLVTVNTSELKSYVDTLMWRVWHNDVWQALIFPSIEWRRVLILSWRYIWSHYSKVLLSFDGHLRKSFVATEENKLYVVCHLYTLLLSVACFTVYYGAGFILI